MRAENVSSSAATRVGHVADGPAARNAAMTAFQSPVPPVTTTCCLQNRPSVIPAISPKLTYIGTRQPASPVDAAIEPMDLVAGRERGLWRRAEASAWLHHYRQQLLIALASMPRRGCRNLEILLRPAQLVEEPRHRALAPFPFLRHSHRPRASA